MSILFKPSGSLNVATDPSDLPEASGQGSISSDAMVRCKNLRINQKGVAKTRDGSAKLNVSAINSVNWLEEQEGYRYAFGGTAIYKDEARIATGLANAQWASIKYNAFNDTTQNIFALNGTDRKRIAGSSVYEWGIAAPTAAPTLYSGAGGGLTGQYNAKYTYVRKVGSTVVSESNPSPAGTYQVLVNGSLAISVTQPTDTQVTHIRIYRTLTNGLLYYYDQEIAVNFVYDYGYAHAWESTDGYIAGDGWKFTTTDSTHSTENAFTWETRFIDSTTTITAPVYSQPFETVDSTSADSSLGDLLAEDHDRPPLGTFVFGPAYDGTCFIIKNNLLHYCKAKQPEYWPALYYIEVSVPQFPGITGVFHNGQPYFLTKNEIYYIQGTGHGTFFPLPMKAKCGAQSVRGAISIANKGIFHTGPDGIYAFAGGTDIKITEDALEPIFRGETVQGLPGVSDMSTSWLWVYQNTLYFGYQSTGYSYPTNVLVLNLETNKLNYFSYGVEVRSVTTDNTNKRFLIGGHDGFVRVIESTAYTTDAGADISWETQSKDFELQTRKHFPRWVKWDVDASNATTCTGSLLLDGVVHQTHTITGNRNTNRRLVGTGNGNKSAFRLSGTGVVSIYAAEGE